MTDEEIYSQQEIRTSGLSLDLLKSFLEDPQFCYKRVCAEIERYENRLANIRFLGSSYRIHQERNPIKARELVPQIIKLRSDEKIAEDYLVNLRATHAFLHGYLNPGIN